MDRSTRSDAKVNIAVELLTSRRPYRLTLSVYGATAASYDGLTRRRGSFAKFERGLAAAYEAGLPINLNLIVARHNAHEVDQMRAMAEGLGLPYHVFSNMSPTIYGGAESLARPIPGIPAQTPAIHRLQRRAHVLPRRPTRHGQHLQSRPGPANPAHRGRCRGARPARRDRRQPAASARRL